MEPGVKNRQSIEPVEDDQSTVHVSLVLRDFDGPPSEVTRLLGIAPTREAAKGDRRTTVTGRATTQTHLHSYWALTSGLDSAAPLERHVDSLLSSVETSAGELRNIGSPTVKQIYCTVIPAGTVPLIELKSDTLASVAALGCDIVIDVLHIDPDE